METKRLAAEKARSTWPWARGLSVLALAFWLLTFAPAQGPQPAEAAAEPMRIGLMHISVMPEYDQPRIVVQAQGQLIDPGLPADLRLLLPTNAQVTHACFLKKPGDEHVCQRFSAENANDATVLTYQVPGADFFVEYAYAYVTGPGERSFEFSFLPTYPTDRLEVSVQEPLRSTNFAISPPEAGQFTDRDGFRYHSYSYSSIGPEQPIRLQFSYSKDDIRPSVSLSSEAQDDKTAQTSKNLIYGLVLGGGVLAVILMVTTRGHRLLGGPAARGGDADLSLAQTWGSAAASDDRARPASAGRPGADAATAAGPSPSHRSPAPRFCSRCGNSLQNPARFCPTCGSAVDRASPGGRA